MARPGRKLFPIFGWALALANGSGDGRRRGWVSRHRISQRSEWLDLGCRGHWVGKRRPLPDTVTIASGLIAAALPAVGSGSVVLTGMPASPAPCGLLAVRAAVTCLWLVGQVPAFAAFEEATATARMPAAGAEWLTRRQCQKKLRMAHGRDDSRAVRRRGGGTSRRHLAPLSSSPSVGDPAAHTSQRTCSGLVVPKRNWMWDEREPKTRSTDRGMDRLALR
jgi:hypothetical protein